MGALRCRVPLAHVLAWSCALACAACTGSENQVFTPFQSTTHPPVAGHGADSGAAADGGKPSRDDDAGRPLLVNTGLDPDAQFIWTETQPGHSGACEPGIYTGSFECTFDVSGGYSRLIGSIEITLATQTMSTNLTIEHSRVLGFSGSSPSFSSSLAGELDCATARFTATMRDSTAFAFPQNFESKPSLMSIDGSFAGDFDAEGLLLQGDVELTTSEGWKCTGKFHAQSSR